MSKPFDDVNDDIHAIVYELEGTLEWKLGRIDDLYRALMLRQAGYVTQIEELQSDVDRLSKARGETWNMTPLQKRLLERNQELERQLQAAIRELNEVRSAP